MHHVGHHYPVWFCQRLQPRGDVDPVAVDRTVGLLYNVAKMNADSKSHSIIFRHCICGSLQCLLNPKRCCNRPLFDFSANHYAVSSKPYRKIDRKFTLPNPIKFYNYQRNVVLGSLPPGKLIEFVVDGI